jgi:hypothetical protein
MGFPPLGVCGLSSLEDWSPLDEYSFTDGRLLLLLQVLLLLQLQVLLLLVLLVEA